MPVFANVALFQTAWFACVLGAAHGLAWAGSLTALTVALMHLWFARRAGLEARLLLSVMGIGVAWDSLTRAAGFIGFADDGWLHPLAPHWMAALWLVFATTLNVSLRWLRGRPWFAALLGLVGGPLAYYAGVQLGALHFPNPAAGLVVQAMGWSALMPLLVRLAIRFDGVAPRRFGESAYV